MRVLHVLNSGHWGGAERVVYNMCKLQKSLYDVQLILLNGEINKTFLELNIKVHILNKLTYGAIRTIVKSENIELIHSHDFRAHILVQLANTSAKNVSQIHQNPKWLKKIRPLKGLCTLLSQKSTRYIVVSNQVSLPTYRKVYTVNNLVTIPEVAVGIDKKWDIGYVGRLSPEKDPLLFVDLAESLLSAGLISNAVIVGKGILEKELRSYINTRNLVEVIDLIGFIDNVAPVVTKIDSLINTSEREGFGLAAVEACLLSVPTFYRADSGLGKVLGDKYSRFSYKSHSELIEKYKLYKNLSIDSWMGDLFHVCKSYSDPNRFIQEIEKVYNS